MYSLVGTNVTEFPPCAGGRLHLCKCLSAVVLGMSTMLFSFKTEDKNSRETIHTSLFCKILINNITFTQRFYSHLINMNKYEGKVKSSRPSLQPT